MVLDLDETLVHTTTDLVEEYDYKFRQPCVDGEGFLTVFVRLRPFLDIFLEFMAKYYELVVFTAAQQEVQLFDQYADYVIDFLDKKKLISRRYYRQHCTRSKNTNLKDLTKLNADLKDIILIDDTAQCMKLQPHNGLVIKSFYMDMRDKELMRLMPFLVFLSEVDDARTVRDWFRKFNEEEKIPYKDKNRNSKILNRDHFLKYVVDKIHTEHLDFIFHGQDGDKNVVVVPPNRSMNMKMMRESMEELATSDVDYEEIHK